MRTLSIVLGLFMPCVLLSQPIESIIVGQRPADFYGMVRMQARAGDYDLFFVGSDSSGQQVVKHVIVGDDPLLVVQPQRDLFWGGQMELGIVSVTSDSNYWSILISGKRHPASPDPGDSSMYVLACGNDSSVFLDTVFAGLWHWPPLFGDILLHHAEVFMKPGAGPIVTCASSYTQWQPALVEVFSYDSYSLDQLSHFEYQPPGWVSITTQSAELLGSDTLTISLYRQGWGSKFIRFDGSEFEQIDQECGGAFRQIALRRSGAILGFTDYDVYEIHSDGVCVDTSHLGSHYGTEIWNPNYGLLIFTFSPWGTLCAKFDTNFVSIHGFGSLGVYTGLSLNGTVAAITPDGTMLVPYILETQLLIGTYPWNLMLDTPEQQAPAIPNEISLSSFPNPFNSTVTIKYDLPKAGHAKLTAYDLQGRTVATLFDDFAPAGSTELHWSPENLASGVYFITLEAPMARATQKILYLK